MQPRMRLAFWAKPERLSLSWRACLEDFLIRERGASTGIEYHIPAWPIDKHTCFSAARLDVKRKFPFTTQRAVVRRDLQSHTAPLCQVPASGQLWPPTPHSPLPPQAPGRLERLRACIRGDFTFAHTRQDWAVWAASSSVKQTSTRYAPEKQGWPKLVPGRTLCVI